jgi:hypothetical protein
VSGIFNASIFNNAVFNTGVSASAGVFPQSGRRGKRRRILPDGSSIYATDLEMAQILRQYRAQKAIEAKRGVTVPAKPQPQITVKASRPIVLPELVFEDQRRLKQLREEEEFILLIHESTRRSH